MSGFDDCLKLAGTAVLRNPVLMGETVTMDSVEYDVLLNPYVSDMQAQADRVNGNEEPMASVDFSSDVAQPTDGHIIIRANGQRLRIINVMRLDFAWRCYCRIL